MNKENKNKLISIYINILIKPKTVLKTPNPTNKGQGDILTIWKGW